MPVQPVHRVADPFAHRAGQLRLGQQPEVAGGGQRDVLEGELKMGAHTRTLIVQAKRSFEERDVEMARDLVRRDDVVDELNRDCFHLALEIGDDADRREWAMTMLLAARAIERVGDNAVDIGEQVAFVVTGLFREFEDASHPS